MDSTNPFIHLLEGDLCLPIAPQAGEFVSPLDEQDAVGGEQVIEGERFQFALGVNALEVNVIERNAGTPVFVDQGESGTRHVFRSSGLEAFGNSLDQGRFPGSEIAAEKHHQRRRQIKSELSSEGDCLVGRMSGGFGCHPTKTVYSVSSCWFLAASVRFVAGQATERSRVPSRQSETGWCL